MATRVDRRICELEGPEVTVMLTLFVCVCSREFAHRVKSISMSKFTEKEVQQLIDRGGNEVGAARAAIC